ncbi:MAG: glycosyltransferase [bacterium]
MSKNQRTNQNLKIFYLLTDSDFGGTEASVMRLATGMRQRGFKIEICSIKRPGYMARDMMRQGFKVASLDLPSGITWNYPFLFLTGIMRLKKLLKEVNPDIIHSFLFQSNLMTAMSRSFIDGEKASIRYISSVRCTEANKSQWRIILDRWALGRSDLVLTVSEAVRNKYLKREKIQQNRIRVLYHGVEQRFMEEQKKISEFRFKLGIGEKDEMIGTVARLHKDKDIKILIRAFALALKSRPEIRLLIIGDGPEKNKLKEIALTLGIMDRIIFTGFRPDVLPLIGLLDIFCLTSKEEGFPQSLIEAMALEKPVVVSRVGGVMELIEDGISGILIPPGNPETIGDSILYLLQNPQKARKMGKAAKERVKHGFLLDHTLDKMEVIYGEVLNKVREVR